MILAAGTCTVTADQAGDVNYNAAPQVTATVINTAPVIALTSPTSQTSLTAPANLTLTATATEAGGTIAQVEFYYGTTKIATVATGSSGNTGTTYTASWTNVPAGSYVLTAKAIDALGGIKTSTPLTVTVNAVAAQAQVYYIHADHLGTPRAITTSDAANVKVWEWKNDDPFGTNQPNQDPNATGTAFQYNLRFPGQYYDMETNTHYNYFRDYDPSIGRYVQSDPIGLKGGNNTYAYADGSPTSRSDLLGLATQMCTAPLHALTKSFGKSVSGFAHDKIPMAHHQYVCVSDGKGGWICGGQDQRGKKWYDPIHGPGTKSDDSYNQEMCKEKEPDDKELEQCLIRKFDGARPNYGIPFGTDCQEWAEKIIEECKSDVKRARDTRRRAG